MMPCADIQIASVVVTRPLIHRATGMMTIEIGLNPPPDRF